MTEPVSITNGPYRGALHPDFAALRPWLAEIESWVASPDEVLTDGRNRVVRLDADADRPALVIKHFRPPGWPKSIGDAHVGSKAFRSWQTARHLEQRGVGTPQPVAWIDVWQKRSLRESYFVSVHEPYLINLMSELIRLYREDPICRKLMNLLERVAHGTRALHDAGVLHRDLGNQNIALRRTGDGTYSEALFIDLNRARVKPFLTLRDRARDISRIHLPSDLLRILVEMYFGSRPPEDFQVWERRYRRRYNRHARTRRYRHPIRRCLRPSPGDPSRMYPRPKDIWIWDDRSVQAVNALRRKDRNRLHSRKDTLCQAVSTVRALPGVQARYRELLGASFQQPVHLADRIGLAVEPTPGGADREHEWLSSLGRIPALVRLYHHQGPAGLEAGAAWVERLASEGRSVAVALVQDRTAVTDPGSWRRFVGQSVERLHGCVDWIEIGHAVNRVKWGIWHLREYQGMMTPIADLRERFPELQIMGPAGIDFEFPYVLAALSRLPSGTRFDALSHHLYVDRRGAPENPQGPFALLEKCAMARAIAGWSHRCADRLIISEVNWPLRGTGVWSPVVSPYDTPGPRHNDPSVSEDEYAAYMIRYFLIALCSGMVERVYWWRLAARGFGLVDDTRPEAWRARPAYRLLAVFLEQVGQATFIARREVGAGTQLYLFRRPDESRVVIGYSTVAGDKVRIPFAHGATQDGFGRSCATPAALPGLPMYFQDPDGFAR